MELDLSQVIYIKKMQLQPGNFLLSKISPSKCTSMFVRDV